MTLADEMQVIEDAGLAAIIRSTSDAVTSASIAGIVTSWNDAAATLYGREADQMIGSSIELTIPEDSLADERARHDRVATGACDGSFRCVRVRADGTPLDVMMSMSAIHDRTGSVVGVSSISHAITTPKNMYSNFSSLLAAAPDAMLCVDASGVIVLVNARACILFGYSEAELVGMTIESLTPEDVQATHRKLREDFRRAPQARALESRAGLSARRRDGSSFPVEISLWPEQDGPEALVIAAVRDVTARRASQAQLLESETRLRELTENSRDAVFLVQLHPLAMLYLSPSFETITGLAVRDVLSDATAVTKLVHPEDHQRVLALYRTALRDGHPLSTELRFKRPDGEVRWARLHAAPIPNPHGSTERMTGAAQDITDQVAAAQELRDAAAAVLAANEAKNEFLSRMSHELRTPMNAVLGFGQLLERRLEGTEHVEPIHQILRAGAHLLELINEVLDIAKIEAGELKVSLEPGSITTMVDEATMLMQPLADAAGVHLTVDGGPVDTYVLADCQGLRQILLNLISNAIKYNHAGGNVWVSWMAEGAVRTIRVRDDGPGVSASNHHRLFLPFDRLGAEATGVEGTGIGLTVSRGLAELMGGALTVRSEEGIGSTFSITLPRAAAPTIPLPGALMMHTRESATPGPGSPTPTLLYIENNEQNVKVMESIIELRPHWRMIHAGLVSLGIDLARAHRPSLILLDVHLPDGDGLDVLTALQVDPTTAQIPVVVLSADASHKQRDRLLAGGADQYLTKPLNLAGVLGVLDEVAKHLPAVSGTQ